jgi:hypothetical protein
MNNQLIEFLDNLKCDIEQDNISDENIQLLGEFYMKYEFINNKNPINKKDDHSKYLILGWYIYNVIMKNFI